jgi:hypothetical protein
MFQAHANRLIREAQRCIDDERARLLAANDRSRITHAVSGRSAEQTVRDTSATTERQRSTTSFPTVAREGPPSQNLNADY